MSCKSAILDLTNDCLLNIKIDKDVPLGTEYIIEFEDIPNLNGGHKLVLENEEYTIGNGLAIVSGFLLWTFTRTPFGANVIKMRGYLESLSLVGGEYYRLNINIHVR
jgi:hypothetical protein